MRIAVFVVGFCFVLHASLSAQDPKYEFAPGFNAQECDDMLALNFAFLDTTKNNRFEDFLNYHRFVYRSPNIGLDNAWDLWIRNDSTVVITLRGTTADPKSIVADFFCAMSPAEGDLAISPGDTLHYKLATDKRAAVHTGFLIGFGFLARDMLPKIDSLYKRGYHHYLITGHSQGGSLTYYISSWLLYLKAEGIYPAINVKAYASAPPKMGNMYFAYDYDNITHSEWAFSIVNTADAVPEMPFTTQQMDANLDMNEPNPVLNLYKRFDHLPLIKRIVVKSAFNRMRRHARKSSRAYQKYLGGYSSKFIQAMLPGVSIPPTVNTTYFVRPGVPIILKVNDDYFRHYTINDGPYYHHGVNPYRYLLRQYYEGLGELKE